MSLPSTLLAGRYRLDELIATGGMGVVWKGWDELLERPVAVKQLRTELGVTEEEAELAKNRAMREARITARLHHPHAVLVFDAVESDGQPCLVMQYLPSIPLSAVVRQRGPLPLAEVARIGAEIASALAAAHQLGIVHRDVKPGNILIAEDGQALISDFGISHALGDATLTSTGLVHGTPAFLAPEVARGEDSSFSSDVFSLGSTLYAAVEGQPPFGMDNNSIAMLHRVAMGKVEAPEHGGLLTALLMEMLDNTPEARPSMRTVATRLRKLQSRAEADADDDAPPAAPVGVLAPVPDEAPGGRPGSGATGIVTTEALAQQDPDADVMANWFEEHAATVEEVRAAAALPEAPAAPQTEDSLAQPLPAEREAPAGAAPVEPATESIETEAAPEPHARRAAKDGATVPTARTPVLPVAAADRVAEPAPAHAAPPPAHEATIEPAEPAERDRRRRRFLVIGIAALGLVLLLALMLMDSLVRGTLRPATTPSTAPSRPAAASAPARTGAASSSTSPSASTSPSPSTTATSSATKSPSPTPTTKPSSASASSKPTASSKPKPTATSNPAPAGALTPRAALTSYYGLLPGNRDAAWNRLTPHFQSTTAGPRSYFDTFWGRMSRVSVSNIDPAGSREATATVTLHFKNGTTEVDRSKFWFVKSGGILKIDRQQNQ